MIYKNNVNFPYPLYCNDSAEYKNPVFDLDVQLKDDSEYFYFTVKIDMRSDFIEKLLKDNKAKYILIIKSNDNKIFELKYLKQETISIAKNELSLNNKTKLQLMIKSVAEINFSDNDELDDFFDEYRSEIIVYPNRCLGMSNIVTFDGTQNYPLEIFGKSFSKEIESDVEFKVGEQLIHIVFKDDENKNNKLILGDAYYYPYMYMGLQKALMLFIEEAKRILEDDNIEFDDEINLEDITEKSISPLNEKLLNLMLSKNVRSISFESIDEVIYKVTDKLLSKYENTLTEKLNSVEGDTE